MQIMFNPTINNNTKYNQPVFCMKKSEFCRIDRYMVERTKAPIEGYKKVEQFYDFCNNLVDNIIKKFKKEGFGGRQRETEIQRKSMLQEWFSYVCQRNSAYTAPIKLMILDSITKKLKPNEDTLPPVLNKGVLADTVEYIQNELDANEKAQFNFDKEYRLKLQQSIVGIHKNNIDSSLNGWIIIPSKRHDLINFHKNVEKLKMLSHDNWCTKSFNAKPYLSEGDFHVYMENGNPKLGVRFVGNKIQEIQGELNNCNIPYKYHEIAEEHIKGYKLSDTAKDELSKLEKTKKEIERIQERFPNGIKNATTQEILETFGINCEKDADGFLTIDQFRNPDFNITYSDLGINVNKLLKDIKAVKGSLYVDNNISTLGNIEHIGGNAVINSASITDLGNLRTVDGSMNLSGRNIKSLGKLENVGGSVHFFDNKDLENQYIKLLKNKLPNDLDNAPATEIFDKLSVKYHIDTDGMLILENFKLLSDGFTYADLGIKVEKLLESVKAIKGTAHFNNLKLKNIGNVTSIGTAYFDGAEIETLGKLKTVNGDFDAYSDSSKIKSIGELDFIGGFSCFANKKLEREFIKNVKNKFPNGVKKATPQEILEAFHIKYKVDNDGLLIISHFKTPSIELSKFGIDINKLFNHIKKIEGDARFSDDGLKSLGMLESIGGDAIFENTKLKKLKKLKSIGGEAEFGSYVKKLGDLEFIGGDVTYHDDSKLKLSDFENITVLGKVN